MDGAPDTSPAGAKLRRDLERWLSGIDWETIQRAYSDEQYEKIPTYKWSHDGWEVLFEPISKGAAVRGTQAAQAIGMTMPMHAMQLNLDREIKEAVIKKRPIRKPQIALCRCGSGHSRLCHQKD